MYISNLPCETHWHVISDVIGQASEQKISSHLLNI